MIYPVISKNNNQSSVSDAEIQRSTDNQGNINLKEFLKSKNYIQNEKGGPYEVNSVNLVCVLIRLPTG